MRNLLKIYVLLYLVGVAQGGFFSNSLDKLKKKAKEAYQKKVGKGAPLNFWGHEPGEYPGANNKFREENRAKWNEYYQCLNAQAKNVNAQKTVIPEAVIGFETSFITMDCKICLNPLETQNKESVVWEWAAKEDEVMSPIEYTEHILVSPEDRSLHIFNLNGEHTGQYMCKLGTSMVAPYFLTVINISENAMNEVHSPSAPSGPYAKEAEEIDYNLVLDTEWGDWSACSKCDDIGRKHKLGYCNVYSKRQGSSEPVTQEVPTNRTKRSEDQIKELFDIFKFGIPCQSHILPDSLRRVPQIKNRNNEIMSGYCKVKCPESKGFEVRDKDGNVIERADNAQGIYSLTQKLPPMEPPTERRVQYEAKGKDIVLECPGNVDSDAPLQWQIGDKNLLPERISKESGGRIYISITDRIHINKAKISDSNIYCCWQQKELAGTIRLVVEKRLELNFNHTIMLFGIVLIMGTFLHVFVKIIANRELTKTQ